MDQLKSYIVNYSECLTQNKVWKVTKQAHSHTIIQDIECTHRDR